MYPKYIKTVLKDLTDKGYNVLYIGAFGSFNYGLETNNSDYDMKAIINIDTSKLSSTSSSEQKTFNYEFGQCEVVNLIEFGKKLSTFEIPYIEVLFSKINYVNEDFDYERLRNVVNDALVNNRKFLLSKFLSTMKKIDATFMKSNILDFTGKKTYNIIRLYNLFKKFNRTKKYGECLFMEEDVKKMLDHKLGKISKTDANKDCDDYISKMYNFTKNNYVETPFKKECINKLVVEMFNELLRKRIIMYERKKYHLKIEKTNHELNLPLIEKVDACVNTEVVKQCKFKNMFVLICVAICMCICMLMITCGYVC